jgi:transposase InsO family protein
MGKGIDTGDAEKWARFRFSIVGPLLAAPPLRGQVGRDLRALAEKVWRHPITAAPVRFGRSTIERWYYRTRNAGDPVGAVRRRIRKDAGTQPSLPAPVRAALRAQHQTHPGWSHRLHYDNLAAQPELRPLPSYATILRWMKSQGLLRRRLHRHRGPGAELADARLQQREVRSYESEYVHALWHADFHIGRRKVLTPRGDWITPKLFGALDDCSRLCCHAQWYLEESAETFVHGLSQAIQKRGLPRALMTDCGSPMSAAETQEGLSQLSISHEPTLPYSPYQNAKQEIFWAAVEGRLMPMLEGVQELTPALLNEATQAWVELEYNRRVHSELGIAPLARMLKGPDVSRPSPDSRALRHAFGVRARRTQRRSDGTLTVEGVRFEVPSRFRHVERLCVRYARWDLGSVDLLDERTGTILCPLFPIDKAKNAEGKRRTLEPIGAPPAPSEMAPLLKKLMADYAATGLPPAYIPKPVSQEES